MVFLVSQHVMLEMVRMSRSVSPLVSRNPANA